MKRIVSLAPSATSILCELGARKHLVGVTRWCRDVAPVNGLPALGDCWHGDADAVARLKPDLVIGSIPYKAETVGALLRRNLTFLAMNPRTLADIFSDIEMLGSMVGRERQAKGVISNLKSQMKKVATRARRARARPRVYCEVWSNPFIVAPPWVEEMVQFAGGRFVPAPGGRRVTEEEVLAARPEIIVVAWAACGLKVDTRKVLRRPRWERLPAFRSGRVFLVSDETLNTPGPPIADGLERLAKIIHPEIFGEPADRKVVRLR
jgi:iron complex transport system substrate-binding protein